MSSLEELTSNVIAFRIDHANPPGQPLGEQRVSKVRICAPPTTLNPPKSAMLMPLFKDMRNWSSFSPSRNDTGDHR